MKSKPTTLLLAIIAALLAANLFVSLPAATAGGPDDDDRPTTPTTPTVIGIAAIRIPAGGGNQRPQIFRIWSDGMVEENIKLCGGVWCGWETVPE